MTNYTIEYETASHSKPGKTLVKTICRMAESEKSARYEFVENSGIIPTAVYATN
jgi:hypothetical protein